MKPDFIALSRKYKTPSQVQKLIRTFPYNKEEERETQRSALSALQAGSMHCLESVLVAAAILENRGYPPLILSLESVDNLDHVIFIFKENSGWGSVGKSRMEGLHGRSPVFRSVRDLAWSYFDPFIDETGRLKAYGVANLDELRGAWRDSGKNLWCLVDDLIHLRHKKMMSSEMRYQRFYNYFKRTGNSGIRQSFWW